jgi:hypothetical protein
MVTQLPTQQELLTLRPLQPAHALPSSPRTYWYVVSSFLHAGVSPNNTIDRKEYHTGHT